MKNDAIYGPPEEIFEKREVESNEKAPKKQK